jgi:hypothetical protein
MKATIRDSTILRAVRPHDVVAYLRAQHWREREHHEGQYAIWQRKSDNEPVEILLPLNKAYRDYATRIAEALQTLEAVEQRSQRDILADIQNVACDVTHISAESEALSGGTISLHGGAQFVASVQRLMLAAACSAVQPRPVYGNHVPAAAAAYVQQARIGIGHGSFAVAVYTPVASDVQPQVRPGSRKTPFARRVTLLLIQALHTLRDAADRAARSGTIEPLLEVAPGGVSADLCDALVGLYEGSHADQIRFNVAWSPLRPAPADAVSAVDLPAGVVPLLQATSSTLRDAALREGVAVQGFITRLERTAPTSGEATISGLIDGALRSVVCDLAGENYRRALAAYERRQTIQCIGDLTREGERYVLRNLRDVTILE